ncbi:glycosyltransferase [Cohnella yongneupensis]|uniref:Glycosyltransferase n=1 Tax=Cohnella yongneupensis TaxID=425006 RepID=A0ABW0QXD2_9BACL
MSSAPQFSIILPTRNRSFIVEQAIQSVLDQTYQDWELIVVDNDVDNKTYDAVHKYIGDKIKYVRTGDLPMHDNWQRGLDEARGNYITVLEDKASYAPYALETIDSIIKKNLDTSVFVWGYAYNAKFPSTFESTIDTYRFASDEIIKLFLNEHHSGITPVLPKMIFSCCHRSILDHCNARNERLFQSMSPDYTSMFAQLSYFEHVLLIDVQLVQFNSQFSNGKDFMLKKFNSKDMSDFIKLTLNGDIDESFRYSSLRMDTLYNVLISEFNNGKRRYGGNLEPFHMNKINVFREAANQIYEMTSYGVDMNPEKLQLKNELENEPSFIRTLVEQYEEQVKLKLLKPQFEFATSFVTGILSCLLSAGKKIAIWGAGDTTRYILSHLEQNLQSIKYIIDSDVSKQDKAMSGIMVKGPSFLKEQQVDVVFVSILKFQEEITNEIKSMNLDCKILTPDNIKDFIKV